MLDSVLATLFVHSVGICSGLEICTLKVAFGKQISRLGFSCCLQHKIIFPVQVENSHWFFFFFWMYKTVSWNAKFPLWNDSITKCVLLSPPAPTAPEQPISLSVKRCLCGCEHLAVRPQECLRGMALCKAVWIDIYRLSHLLLVHDPGSFVVCLLKFTVALYRFPSLWEEN